MKEIITAIDVEKSYGIKESSFKALKDVDLSICEGDFIGIMGPSGSGKSTLINIMSTIDIPTGGKVIINGKNVKAMNEVDIAKFRYENIGFIFQEFNLIDELTLRENIGIPLLTAGKSKEQIKLKVEEVSVKLGISEILDKYPAQCSGGQKQRAASARALVNNPKLIIADEPTGNLDTKNSHEMLSLLKQMNDNEGKTILMVTHDSMIASYSKKLLFIRDGKIDDIIERGEMSQKEFFYEIVDITSKETQQLFDMIGN
ncbi:MAG: ABC transporter ATP-binding protein [Clostridium sp.]